MEISIERGQGAQLIVNGETVNIRKAVFLIQLDRSNTLEAELAKGLTKMAQDNELGRRADQILGYLGTFQTSRPGGISTYPDSDQDFLIRNGIVPFREVELVIEDLKRFLDRINARGQEEMILLNSLFKRRDEALSLPTQVGSAIIAQQIGIINNLT